MKFTHFVHNLKIFKLLVISKAQLKFSGKFFGKFSSPQIATQLHNTTSYPCEQCILLYIFRGEPAWCSAESWFCCRYGAIFYIEIVFIWSPIDDVLRILLLYMIDNGSIFHAVWLTLYI